MNKQIILIGVIILVILAVIAGVVIFNLQGSRVDSSPENQENSLTAEEKIAGEEARRESEEIYNQQFPDVVRGIINIVSNEKTTITADDGTEYLISPALPLSFYRNSGIESNLYVEIRGNMLENNKLSLAYVILIKE